MGTPPRLDFDLTCVRYPGFRSGDRSKTLELGQSKAKNGFSTFKIGGHRVDIVIWLSVGLVGRRMGQLAISWSEWASVGTASRP